MMNKLVVFSAGIAVGAVIGVGVSLLLTPASGEEMRDGAREHFHNALEESARAAAARRAELEAELSQLTRHSEASEDASFS